MSDMRTCRDCGAEFKRSPADSTVRCPACRRGGKPSSEAPCFVCGGAGSYVTGPSAVDGRMTRVVCHRCEGSGVRPA